MTTSLSSAALTMLSPSSVALMVSSGALLSSVTSNASVAGLTLPATSVDVAVKACGPSTKGVVGVKVNTPGVAVSTAVPSRVPLS